MGVIDEWRALMGNPQETNNNNQDSKSDCTECRVIGTVACSGAGCYTLWSTLAKDMKGASRSLKIRYYSFGTCLSLTFFTLAICRAFDLSMFNAKNKDKTPLQILNEDIKWFREKKFFSKD
ncbi:unnamed protein product [Dimorphilus gyrociliatus]|uniref:Uncharacterized protein n=1 Tax=Dimorphilus gyrociliatus TaxID=2664684 RepID=A0A7I8W693_9ANNE|nr:unnamed protein product [Dimorphilus gyrociliatus]